MNRRDWMTKRYIDSKTMASTYLCIHGLPVFKSDGHLLPCWQCFIRSFLELFKR